MSERDEKIAKMIGPRFVCGWGTPGVECHRLGDPQKHCNACVPPRLPTKCKWLRKDKTIPDFEHDPRAADSLMTALFKRGVAVKFYVGPNEIMCTLEGKGGGEWAGYGPDWKAALADAAGKMEVVQ